MGKLGWSRYAYRVASLARKNKLGRKKEPTCKQAGKI
jgi:hypothetical protein